MGGNNFENLDRIPLEEYLVIQEKVLQELSRASTITPLPEKRDFGDLDILVTETPETPLSKEAGRVKNGNVTSILWLEGDLRFQVDLIQVNKEYLESATFYFSYGDRGMLLGRIAAASGLKYGFNGLYYRYSDNQNIFLTRDTSVILEVLGLNYFSPETEEELFEWIKSSPYLMKETFIKEGLNHSRRQRYLKREGYRRFLEQLGEPSGRPLTIPELLKFFPDIPSKVENLVKKEFLSKWKKEVFNGGKVMEVVPNLSGKKLGEFISFVKEDLNYQAFSFLSSSEQKAHIMKKWLSFSKN